MVAFTFDFARSSSFCLLQASSLHSGYTPEVNNIHFPSGDHSSPSASVEMLVIFRGSPVSAPAAESKSCTHTCVPPSLSQRKASRLPSGDQRGRPSETALFIILRDSPPAIGTIQMCCGRLFAARSGSTAVNVTHLPSGEGTGSPTRFNCI